MRIEPGAFVVLCLAALAGCSSSSPASVQQFCASYCNHVHQCDQMKDVQACTIACQSDYGFVNHLRNDLVTQVETCWQQDCSTSLMQCYATVSAMIAPSAGANQLCDELTGAEAKCDATVDKASCLGLLKPFSDDTLHTAEECASLACNQIRACVAAATGCASVGSSGGGGMGGSGGGGMGGSGGGGMGGSGGGGMGGSGGGGTGGTGGGGCIDIGAGPSQSVLVTTAAVPTATGGPIPDGTYTTTGMRIYDMKAPNGLLVGQVAATAVVSGSQLEIAYVITPTKGTQDVYYARGTFTTSGTTLTVTPSCSSSAGSQLFTYSSVVSSGTQQLTLWQTGSNGITTATAFIKQ